MGSGWVSSEGHPLARILGYGFRDPALLRLALTHRSCGGTNNERLEYLGDALLGFLVADLLYRRFPGTDEGQLTRARASLVNREHLARLARELDLGPHLQLGEGERKSGGWRRDSILSNAFEAILGAVYLDGGLDHCRLLTERLFAESLSRISLSPVAKDPKTRLQEYLQGRGQPLPRYTLLHQDGDPHDQRFTVECAVAGLAEGVMAEGNSRRRAEQAAAAAALARLQAPTHIQTHTQGE
jgi:ribonuclease-3